MVPDSQTDKAKIETDVLSQKSCSNSLMIQQHQPFLHKEFFKLNIEIVPSRYLVNMELKLSFEDQIMEKQKHDFVLSKIKRNIAT